MTMTTEFLKAKLPGDLRRLVAFDHQTFSQADWFRRADWEQYETYWMLVDGKRAGCCAFEHDVDFREDTVGENPARLGSLYISTTGILPPFRGQGLGELVKCWQIAYARRHGFRRIVTNMRKSNRPMIGLNKKLGFEIQRISQSDYYREPSEPTVVMERKLPARRSR